MLMHSPEATTLLNSVHHCLAKVFLSWPMGARQGENFLKLPPPPLAHTQLRVQRQAPSPPQRQYPKTGCPPRLPNRFPAQGFPIYKVDLFFSIREKM